MNFSDSGITKIYDDEGAEVGWVELSDAQREFGSDAPFYFGKWLAVANLEVNPKFRKKGYARKIMQSLINWATETGKDGLLLRPMPTGRGGPNSGKLREFYRSLGFRTCDVSPDLMEKFLKKRMVLNLYSALKRFGFHKEASDLKDLIPNSVSADPLATAFAFGDLNIGAFVESGDESDLDIDHINSVLSRAKMHGFSGECAEAAVAINEVLFNREGTIVAAVNKWLYENEERFVGHVAVEWNGRYWDAEGEKDWEEIESWGMADELDYDFEKPEQAYEVEKIYPSKDELLEMFGGCNLKNMIKKLELADIEIYNEKETK
jgi:hypothetical protein